ncbi:hypothetical protein FBQ97_02305 [Acidobacteria bacterium ACD]|nr:hypothetical protein [Acidobacteria bacterium ACB2]MDL1948633.1 hypothetical protein [Acidobacteria bacterium ACD]
MPDWSVPLAGPLETLSRMPDAFKAPQLNVRAEGSDYFMCSTRFSGLTRPIDVIHAADRMLPAAVAIMNAYAGLTGRIEAAGAFWTDPQGQRHGIGVATATARVLSAEGLERLGRADEAGTTLANRLHSLPDGDARVKRAFRELYASEPDWAKLYVLLELVASELRPQTPKAGKDWDAIAQRGWADAAALSRLKETANNHRHAKRSGGRQDSISLGDARRVAREVLWRWLEEKVAAAPTSPPSAIEERPTINPGRTNGI